MGGRIGYSAATGVLVIVLAWFGVIALIMALIPVVAILPILLYIGMLIGSQAFQETPVRHAPAIMLALVPQIAGKTQIDSAQRRRHPAAAVGFDKLDQTACSTTGWRSWAAAPPWPASCWLDHGVHHRARLREGRGLRRGRAVFTFFGLIHAEALGFGQTPSMVMSYLGIAVILLACTKYAGLAPLRGRGVADAWTRRSCRQAG